MKLYTLQSRALYHKNAIEVQITYEGGREIVVIGMDELAAKVPDPTWFGEMLHRHLQAGMSLQGAVDKILGITSSSVNKVFDELREEVLHGDR